LFIFFSIVKERQRDKHEEQRVRGKQQETEFGVRKKGDRNSKNLAGDLGIKERKFVGENRTKQGQQFDGK
jgi:hypothetical protein